jgi:signal transduction histidine kinase/CheY-like chemotaxis protein/HAMP domain-containing protein
MKNIYDMKIINKLILGFSIIVLLTIISGITNLNDVKQIGRLSEDMYMHPLAVSKAVRDIRTNIMAIHRSMKDIALANDSEEIRIAQNKVEEYERQTFKSFDIVFDRFLGDKNDIKKAYDAFVDWKPIRDEVIQLRMEGKTDEAAAITKGKGAKHVELMTQKIQTMLEFANKKGDAYYEEVVRITDSTIKNTLIILTVILLMSLAAASIITINITRPLREMLNVSEQMLGGNLSARNKRISKDETGLLAKTINTLAETIESRIAIQEGVVEVSKTMIGKSSINDFAKSLLKHLLKLGRANMCTFYTLNEVSKKYEHLASIGAKKDMLKSYNSENPQGEFGNALSAKKVFHLKDIPDDTAFNFMTIAGDIVPKEIITIPILVDNNAIAIISLISINTFSSEYIEIIEQSWDSINTSYSNLIASERTAVLAQHLSRTNQQLEAQSEELQEQTEEMQEQTEELLHTSKELQERNLELEAQKAQIEAANKLKSEFLSNMSHELRTPLNSILALSQILMAQAKNKLDKDENEYLEIVNRNGNNLLRLINDILDLSKIEAGKMEINPMSISVGQTLIIVKENLQSLASKKNISFNLNIDENLPMIESDQIKINQILTNIIGNAIKFTENGSVDVSAICDAEYVHIRIKDTGIGIPEELLPDIFEEFRQADGTSSRKYEGTGLGLAIANKLTLVLGGEINVVSELGKGSTFTIILPIKWYGNNSDYIETQVVEPKSEVANKGSENKGLLHKNHKKHILIVDDNTDIIIQMKAVIRQLEYNIEVAYNGQQALESIKKIIPDGIILDLMMPGIDGFELLEKLRGHASTKFVPVLVLTAKDLNKKDLARLSSNNIYQLIQKGDVNIEELRTEIVNMLEGEPKLEQTDAQVLIIEDNSDNMTTIKAILMDRFDIIEASSGEKGLELIHKNHPDLVLLDISLPGISGEEIIKRIKKDKKLMNIPVIAVTAQAMTGDRDRFLSIGFDSYLSKPIDEQNLINEINRFI